MDGYVAIERNLITSDAFVDLSFSARCMFVHFLEKEDPETSLIIFPYDEAELLGVSKHTFRQVLIGLSSHGFIEIVQHGSGGNGITAPNKYRRSNSWMLWGKECGHTEHIFVKDKQKEKRKLSMSLRYQVMRRDRFHCQLCGVTGRDAQLVVDHIYPLDKGGRTELDNLRTLCADCNGGKSNKI